jgi:hypothetical protein
MSERIYFYDADEHHKHDKERHKAEGCAEPDAYSDVVHTDSWV